jgi:hypothetical protein
LANLDRGGGWGRGGKRINMSKQIVEYIINGEVVDEEPEPVPKSSNAFFNYFASFFAGSHKPYNDNGREYNPTSGNWEYSEPARTNGIEPPAEDYQGAVPSWDGYNGE